MKYPKYEFIRSFAYTVAVLAILSGCQAKRLENTKELSREIKASQIKRVTNTQLIYTIDEWGKKISKITEKTLEKELAANPEKGTAYCKDLSQIPLISAMEKEYGVHIQLLGEADITNKDLNPKEKELLEAYLYSAKAKAAVTDNVQQLNDTLIVYNVPATAESSVCKTCMPTQETPFAVWRLLFNKKDMIRKLDAKSLKE
jgi:hypothetical protein